MMEMTVTALEDHPRGRGRINVYLNDKFAFVLYKGELSKYGLAPGVVVNDMLYDTIMNETVFPRARKRGMDLLQTMDRTESDVRSKLTEGGYPPRAVDAAIDYLKSFHYIDDLRYATEFIRTGLGSNSRRMISMKLARKGIDKDVIETAFAQHEEEMGPCDEEESALMQKLIAKRCPQGIENLDAKERQKLYAYLYRKGFSADLFKTE